MAHLDAYLAPHPDYGWEGGPTFRTLIINQKSGRERRNAEWANARHEYSAPFTRITPEAYANIKQMHLVCRGMLHAFRFVDALDFTAANDQFGVGNGTQTVFQLGKTSTISGVTYEREVFALPSTPVITVNGSASSPAVNLRTGKVTFSSAPANGHVLRWTGAFDIWVRFASDSLPFNIENFQAISGTVSLIELPPPES